MRRKKNIRELAEAIGVSTATVSRVLNNKPDVNSATRQRVLDYLRQAEYVPRLASSDIRLIGFVNDYRQYPVNDFYTAGILVGVNDRVHAHGYDVVLVHSELIDREMQWPAQHRILNAVSGLVWSMPVLDQGRKSFLESIDMPCVVVNNLAEGVDSPLVQGDNTGATGQAIEYLVGLGHTKIGYMGGEMRLINLRDRYYGYLEGMKRHGLEVDPGWVVNDISGLTEAEGVMGMHRLLGRKSLPTAILAADDNIATGIYRVAEERGVRIPDDLSVISFDDSVFARHLRPPLTTFQQPLAQMGGSAVEMLLGLMAKPESPPRKIDLGMTLMIRGSVKQPSSL